MSSNRGVFRVSKRDLDDFADGRIKAISSVSYGIADGMKSSECNGGSQPAGWKSRDGRLWFATIRGVVSIDPADIKVNTLAPPRSEEHTSELQSHSDLVCRLLL